MGKWWGWAWQKLHRAGGKVPSLPLGERVGLGRCCPGCWVQQPLDLELLLAITAQLGSWQTLVILSLSFMASHTVDTSPVNRKH